MQLESTLAQFPLPELITMIVRSSVTGVLEVGAATGGRLFFRDGILYHADAAEHRGVPAVCHIFMLKNAPFCFTASVATETQTLWHDPWDLIEYAQQHARMWERIEQHISSFDCVPVLCQTNADSVQINEAAWRTLSAIDGYRSIEAVAAQIGQVPLEVAVALCDLIEQGVVRLKSPRGPLLSERRKGGQGFFGRLMSTTPANDNRN